MRRARIPHRADAQRGFTLLEVMAALVIFLTGVVFVLALFAAGLAQHRVANQDAKVAEAAEVVREELDRMLLELGEVDPGVELPAPKEQPVPGHQHCFYTVETIEPDPESGVRGGVLLDVHVYVKDAGRRRGKRFTLFSRPRSNPELLIRRARGDAVASPGRVGSNQESGR